MELAKTHAEFQQLCVDNPIKLRRKLEYNKKNESVFIDFRVLPHIKNVIYNCINKLNDEWSHSIVCGIENYDFIMQLVGNHKIKIIKLDNLIKNVNQYNNLLLTVDFWKLFHGEKLLIYQEDTYLFHGNILKSLLGKNISLNLRPPSFYF